MFGIGGEELVFILFVVLMLFGSDKIPDIARGLAKGMAQIKNATNEIKHEISKSVDETNVINDIKEAVNVDNLKNAIGLEDIKKSVGIDDLKESINLDQFNPLQDVRKEIEETKEDLESMTGPIKRMK